MIHLIRGDATGKRIAAEYGLLDRVERPLLSIVSVGESLALAEVWGWGPTKQQALRNLLSELVVVGPQHPGVVERYGELTARCKSRGWNLGDNDRWIAATAIGTSAWLLTLDKDFAPLPGVGLQLALVTP